MTKIIKQGLGCETRESLRSGAEHCVILTEKYSAGERKGGE